MSRRNSIVVPGGKMGLTIELIFAPVIEKIVQKSKTLKSKIRCKNPVCQAVGVV